MIFRDFGAALLRHRIVALVVAAVTLAFAFGAATAKPRYQTQAVITMLSPKTPFPRNAYASFTPNLVLMGDVLSRTMETASAHALVRRAGGSADFTVVLFNRGTEQYPVYDTPYLTVTTNSGSKQDAERTQAAVLSVLDTELHHRQSRSGALPGSYIDWRITKINSSAVQVTGQPSRQMLAILLLGLIVAIYLSLVADRHGDRLRALVRRVTGARPSLPTAGADSR